MKNMNVMIVGVGGQGTLLTSRIIGHVALNSGLDVKISEVHGMAQRGGSVVTFVRFGEKVYEPVVEEGTADVIIAFERLEAKRYAKFLKKDGVLIVNDYRIDPMSVVVGAKKYPSNIIEELKEKYNVISLDAGKIASELGNGKVVNSIMLGVASKYIGFTKELWLETLVAKVPSKTIEINKQAFLRGVEC